MPHFKTDRVFVAFDRFSFGSLAFMAGFFQNMIFRKSGRHTSKVVDGTMLLTHAMIWTFR